MNDSNRNPEYIIQFSVTTVAQRENMVNSVELVLLSAGNSLNCPITFNKLLFGLG